MHFNEPDAGATPAGLDAAVDEIMPSHSRLQDLAGKLLTCGSCTTILHDTFIEFVLHSNGGVLVATLVIERFTIKSFEE